MSSKTLSIFSSSSTDWAAESGGFIPGRLLSVHYFMKRRSFLGNHFPTNITFHKVDLLAVYCLSLKMAPRMPLQVVNICSFVLTFGKFTDERISFQMNNKMSP